MESLNAILLRATEEHWAVPHFNFSTLEQLRAIVEVCDELSSPVIVGTSEGEREFIGLKQALALVYSWQESGIPVFLNADHTKSVELAKEAIDAGYKSIHIDLSKKEIKENIAGTKEVAEYARKIDPQISIEGEVGIIVTDSSTVYEREVVVDPSTLTDPKQAQEFVVLTGVNRFAPAVGSIHGVAANVPNIDFERISNIRAVLSQDVAIVLHGGSGIDSKDLKKAIEAGVANVHISTDIRRAWKEGVASSFAENPEEFATYKLLTKPLREIKKVVGVVVSTIGSAGKANGL